MTENDEESALLSSAARGINLRRPELGLKVQTLRARIKALGIRVPDRERPRRYSCKELMCALNQAEGNKSRAAQHLGINRITLGRQLKKPSSDTR